MVSHQGQNSPEEFESPEGGPIHLRLSDLVLEVRNDFRISH